MINERRRSSIVSQPSYDRLGPLPATTQLSSQATPIAWNAYLMTETYELYRVDDNRLLISVLLHAGADANIAENKVNPAALQF